MGSSSFVFGGLNETAHRSHDKLEADKEWRPLHEEEAATAVGSNGSGMMGLGMMGPGIMNGHMDWQDAGPPVTPYPGQNSTWGHQGMNGNNGSWQGDGCCGWGMMRPGN